MSNVIRWETEKFVEALKKLPGVKDARATGQGGDYDTSNILVSIVGSSDRLWVAGYPDNAVRWEPCKNPNDTDVAFIELKDGEDSRGGLSSKNKKTAKVYMEIRQYFLDLGADVINTYEDVY